jgi:hypothetical protein
MPGTGCEGAEGQLTPADELVETKVENRYVYARGAVTRDGRRRVLLVEKRDGPFRLSSPGASGGQADWMDQSTGSRSPAASRLTDEKITLGRFSLTVLTLP